MRACADKVASCLLQRASRRLKERFSNPILRRQVLEDVEANGYKAHMWQYVKRLLADELVDCLVEYSRDCLDDCLREIYLADLTGAEHSYVQGHGGKDQDVIIYAPCPQLPRRELERVLEESIEPIARLVVSEALGFDPIEKLGIPNVIEIHIVRDERDAPYYNMIVSPVRRLIRVWPREAVAGQVFPS